MLFAPQHRAGSRGIERADCEPVLAENFPAGTVSPRTACLDGVASCDGIVSILGARYGEPTAAGISATEEEYREAARLKKHIFVFLEGVDREPRQQEFVRAAEDYVDGHWRKSFRSPEELEGLVEQALREGRPMVAAGNAEGGSHERIGAACGQRPDRVESVAWAQVAWTTPRDEEVVDPTSFMDTGFQREVQCLAHEGDAPCSITPRRKPRGWKLPGYASRREIQGTRASYSSRVLLRASLLVTAQPTNPLTRISDP